MQDMSFCVCCHHTRDLMSVFSPWQMEYMITCKYFNESLWLHCVRWTEKCEKINLFCNSYKCWIAFSIQLPNLLMCVDPAGDGDNFFLIEVFTCFFFQLKGSQSHYLKKNKCVGQDFLLYYSRKLKWLTIILIATSAILYWYIISTIMEQVAKN